jgi:pimeloyl-ACP methyl ester carboxylesterase
MPHMTMSDGSRTYYEMHGPEDGAPVMLLHGWCASLRLYVEQTRALADAGYRTILLDSIGHGRSSKKADTMDKDVVVGRFGEFAEKAGLFGGEPFALIGHSAGGGAAQQIYLKHPDKIACLVLLNTGYHMRDSLPRKIFWTFSPQMVEVLFNPVTKLAIRPAMNAAADAAGLIFNKDPHEIRHWLTDVMRTRPDVARMEIEEIMRHNTKSDLPKIKCPTLIIGGSVDLLAPARQSRVMHELIPNSELFIVPTGHAGKMLQSEFYNPPILNFLAKHYPAVKPKKAAAASRLKAKKKVPANIAKKTNDKKPVIKKKAAKKVVVKKK